MIHLATRSFGTVFRQPTALVQLPHSSLMAKQKKRRRPQADDDTPQQATKLPRLDAAAAAPEADGRKAAPQPQAQPQQQQQQPGPLQPSAAEAAELVALHRARFVPWQPAAVVACAFAPDGSVLAVGQESGAIELWETSTWTCFQVRSLMWPLYL